MDRILVRRYNRQFISPEAKKANGQRIKDSMPHEVAKIRARRIELMKKGHA